MDKCGSDAEFDSYWDYEAKNKNRNRIRVGRQYQASVPPLLKPGEKDGRKSEDLETLRWKPGQLTDQQLDQYFSMAKAVTSFAKALDNCCDPDTSPDDTLHAAIKGLTEYVTSHHPSHRDADCKVPISSCSTSSFSPGDSVSTKSPTSEFTAPEAHLFAQAIESCGKNFCAIKKEYLPWKPVCSLIEYYYYHGKGEKPDIAPINVPSIYKMEKTEPPAEKMEAVASCSYDSSRQVASPHTKEEPKVPEEVKEETESRATPVETTSTSSGKKKSASTPTSHMNADDPTQSTVGSLKFFLGGRLVLKLNAQQEGGTKCQWVQSHDPSKHSHQMKKMKHRRKEMAPPETAGSPKHKKKSENHSSVSSDGVIYASKKAKIKPYNMDNGLLSLCSTSWTPPVADGPESAELEDASSSKTSEGCVSPVVISSRTARTDTALADLKRKAIEPADQDHKPLWVRASDEGFPDDYACSMLSYAAEKVSSKSHLEDMCPNFEVLNHKSALPRVKGFLPRSAHSSSPSSKLFNKWPSPSVDAAEKAKSSPNFHSPNSRTCSSSSESSVRDFVLDLSSRLDACKNRSSDLNLSQELACCHASPIGCTENCSSLESSPRTPCSASECAACCKSSNCSAYHTGVVASQESSRDLDNQNAVLMAEDANSSSQNRMGGGSCPSKADQAKESCCCDPSTSCASPKCCKSYSSKEQTCNKDEGTVASANSSPNNSIACTEEAYSKKMPSWFGSQGNSVVQMYPHCYPYYVAYGVNPSAVSNSPAPEIPLDLSNNANASNMDENLLPENVPEIQTDLPKNAADALDRGMLYQLLKNKVSK